MQPIPLVRANVLAPCLDVLQGLGVPTAALLAESNLPSSPETHAEFLIPFQNSCRFLERVARREGIEDLGLRAGERTEVARLGAWGRGIERSLTLHEAIGVILRTQGSFTSAARYSVIDREDDVLFCHRLHESIGVGRSHAVYIVLMGMLNLVRLADVAWTPREVRVAAPIVPQVRAIDALANARIISDPRITAVAISRSLLNAPLARSARCGSESPRAVWEPLSPASPARDFLGSLRQAIAPIVHAGMPDLSVAAEIAGMSVRTLQRRLLEGGVSFSRLIDEVRFSMATRWLEDPRVKLIDVALEVGYSDPAHFTRAFRRWTGVSPREFRRQRGAPPGDRERARATRSGLV